MTISTPSFPCVTWPLVLDRPLFVQFSYGSPGTFFNSSSIFTIPAGTYSTFTPDRGAFSTATEYGSIGSGDVDTLWGQVLGHLHSALAGWRTNIALISPTPSIANFPISGWQIKWRDPAFAEDSDGSIVLPKPAMNPAAPYLISPQYEGVRLDIYARFSVNSAFLVPTANPETNNIIVDAMGEDRMFDFWGLLGWGPEPQVTAPESVVRTIAFKNVASTGTKTVYKFARSAGFSPPAPATINYTWYPLNNTWTPSTDVFYDERSQSAFIGVAESPFTNTTRVTKWSPTNNLTATNFPYVTSAKVFNYRREDPDFHVPLGIPVSFPFILRKTYTSFKTFEDLMDKARENVEFVMYLTPSKSVTGKVVNKNLLEDTNSSISDATDRGLFWSVTFAMKLNN